MTEENVLDQIANEGKEGFSGSLSYKDKKNQKAAPVQLATYRVWNKNPFGGDNEEQVGSPGIIMAYPFGEGENFTIVKETVETVKAVILFTSHGREFVTGSGKTYRTICQSHDGINPSARIDSPSCQDATVQDLVQIMSAWKGADQAKIDANIQTLTHGTPNLQMCGLPTPNGNSPCITMCPFGKRQVTKNKQGIVLKTEKAPCKPTIYVQAYDVQRKRQFKMNLTGKGIWNDTKFVAPFHEFFKFLRLGNGDKSFPSYAFVLDLYAASDGKYYYLGVRNWKPIEQVENRATMEAMALDAKAAYERQAQRVSKEAYEKAKAIKDTERDNKQTNTNTNGATLDKRENSVSNDSDSMGSDSESEGREKEEDISFEDEDIPF